MNECHGIMRQSCECCAKHHESMSKAIENKIVGYECDVVRKLSEDCNIMRNANE